MRCEEPVKILEILRLTEQGYSKNTFLRFVGIAFYLVRY